MAGHDFDLVGAIQAAKDAQEWLCDIVMAGEAADEAYRRMRDIRMMHGWFRVYPR